MNNKELEEEIKKTISETEKGIDIVSIKIHDRSNHVSISYRFKEEPFNEKKHDRTKRNIRHVLYEVIRNNNKKLTITNQDKQRKNPNNTTKKLNDDLVSLSLERNDGYPYNKNNIANSPIFFGMVSMPFSKQYYKEIRKDGVRSEKLEYLVMNNNFEMALFARESIGLPYGSKARLILLYLIDMAIKTNNQTIVLDSSFKQFINNFNYPSTGGEKGTIIPFKEQLMRIIYCTISLKYFDVNRTLHIENTSIVKKSKLWWDDKKKGKIEITLSDDFFNCVKENKYPIDIQIYKALKRSSLAMDIYSWVTYRASYLEEDTFIPWKNIKEQFGSTDTESMHIFKRRFISNLHRVKTLYDVNIFVEENGLLFKPSQTSVPKTKRKKIGNI